MTSFLALECMGIHDAAAPNALHSVAWVMLIHAGTCVFIQSLVRFSWIQAPLSAGDAGCIRPRHCHHHRSAATTSEGLWQAGKTGRHPIPVSQHKWPLQGHILVQVAQDASQGIRNAA